MRAVFLMGPTGTGKTALSLELARRFPLEVISVDSANVYRGMDVGTAKPTPAERQAIPHHLIDIADPAEHYSAGRFRDDALRAIGEIQRKGRLALLAGGTMLYFRSLERGLSPLPKADAEIRARLDAQAKEKGWPELHERLRSIDAVAAERIHEQDGQRIQRALEVYELTGMPISELQNRAVSALPEPPIKLALEPASRELLNENIERRFNAMLENGLLSEVRALFERGDLSARHPAMRAVGYRQLWAHIAGEISLEEATRQAIVATRRLAKRQLTWLRREHETLWLKSGSSDLIQRAVDAIRDGSAANSHSAVIDSLT